MPKPIFVLCAQAVAVNPVSNSLSIYDLLELAQVSQLAEHAAGQPIAPPPGFMPMSFQMVAAWMAEEGDMGQEFDVQIGCRTPSGLEIIQADPVRVRFVTPFQRLFSNRMNILGFPETGTYYFESRIRKAGDSEWMHIQQYPFIVSNQPVMPPATPPLP